MQRTGLALSRRKRKEERVDGAPRLEDDST